MHFVYEDPSKIPLCTKFKITSNVYPYLINSYLLRSASYTKAKLNNHEIISLNAAELSALTSFLATCKFIFRSHLPINAQLLLVTVLSY